jgi:hypothetical protein
MACLCGERFSSNVLAPAVYAVIDAGEAIWSGCLIFLLQAEYCET